jgi:hypothetical protein
MGQRYFHFARQPPGGCQAIFEPESLDRVRSRIGDKFA